MGRLTEVMRRVFKRKSPELYEALREYCQRKGVKIEDALNSAVALYLNADEEGREKLEEAMEQIRLAKRSSVSMEDYINMIKATGDLMTSVQQVARDLVKNSLLNEVKSQIELAKSIARIGEESGGSSTIEGAFANMLLSRVLGVPVPQKTKSGKGKVEEINE